MVGDTRVYGLGLHRVSLDDIHAAITADHPEARGDSAKIYEIDVVSSTEMHIYRRPRTQFSSWYHLVRRIDGKWRYTEQVIEGAIVSDLTRRCS
jgi:hypothetical protein